MLTIAEYKNERQVESYFAEHLSTGEYHTENGKSPGTWVGRLTEQFGLSNDQAIESKDFEAIVKGFNPKTGQSYILRRKSNRIVAREMLFSAPKTVSILAVTMQDDRLKKAHVTAVTEAFEALERLAQSRVRAGQWINADGKRDTGNVIAARFTHETSRELDPQLHTHNVVFNVTFDEQEGRLKALDPNFIYNSTSYVTEIYRSVLARELKSIGYEIEGGRHTWRIKGVSNEIESLFSKRSAQIEKEVQKIQKKTGVDVETRGRALIAGLTRKSKDHKVSEADYVNFQKSQLNLKQFRELQELTERAQPSSIPGRDKDEVAIESVDYALKHVFERSSVVHKHDLIREALKHAMGDASYEDILTHLKDERFIHRGSWIMTREERAREVRILQLVREGKREFESLNTNPSIPDDLEAGQAEALKKVLGSFDQFIYLRGAAGAGKTFLLSEIKRNLDAGLMVSLAPSSSATETLREEGHAEALTLQRFLVSEELQRKSQGKLVVLDEAGLTSTKQMDQFLQVARTNKFRVLLVGDTLQHNSVEGGDALRLIEDYSVIDKAEIGKIRRQKSEIYREAIQNLANGDVAKGWDKLEQKLNAVHEVKGDARFEMIAAEYVQSLKDKKSVLVVCPTHAEITKVNESVRTKLKNEGMIEKLDHQLEVIKSMNFTSVEKQFARNYELGFAVSFHKNEGEFKQGEIWKVKGASQNAVELFHEKHGTKSLDLSNSFKSFDVVKEERKDFSVGDKILIRANFASSPINKLPNGATATIKSFNRDGSISLSNGKYLTPEFRQFELGYALTSQASQGKTTDKVILSANSRSGMAISKNQFYVSCSRGREEISVFTDDKEKLRESVMRSSSRKLVLEELVRDRIIAKRMQKGAVQIERVIEASRDVIEKAFRKFSKSKVDSKSFNMKTILGKSDANEISRSKFDRRSHEKE